VHASGEKKRDSGGSEEVDPALWIELRGLIKMVQDGEGLVDTATQAAEDEDVGGGGGNRGERRGKGRQVLRGDVRDAFCEVGTILGGVLGNGSVVRTSPGLCGFLERIKVSVDCFQRLGDVRIGGPRDPVS